MGGLLKVANILVHIDTIRCPVVFKYTSPAGNSKESTPCKYKYCKQCLKNRYNEDINTYRSQATLGYKYGDMFLAEFPYSYIYIQMPKVQRYMQLY